MKHDIGLADGADKRLRLPATIAVYNETGRLFQVIKRYLGTLESIFLHFFSKVECIR